MTREPDYVRRAREQARRHFERQASPNGDGWREGQRGDAWEGDPEPKPRVPEVEIFTAGDLLAEELPEAKCVVQGIIPEGMSLLAGKPKLGKSWLALGVGLSIATGGVALGDITVEQGDVLYLALEDSKRRLKKRIAKITARQDFDGLPFRLHLVRSCPRQDKGGLMVLIDWIERHPQARLLIIDTWAKFRPSRGRNRDSYEEDYEHAAEIKAVADKYGIAILVLHHCRKMGAEDPLDEVSGTLGLTGAADGVLVMRRERGQHDAALFVTGRDLEDQEIALRWDPEYALWTRLGDADQYRLSRERAKVIEFLAKAGKPLSPGDLAPLMGKSRDACKMLLWRMEQDGYLGKDKEGKYVPVPKTTTF